MTWGGTCDTIGRGRGVDPGFVSYPIPLGKNHVVVGAEPYTPGKKKRVRAIKCNCEVNVRRPCEESSPAEQVLNCHREGVAKVERPSHVGRGEAD